MAILQSVPVITIDGPSGTGKGTICHQLADYLGWHYLDSGAIYRVLAWVSMKKGIDLANIEGLTAEARDLPLSFEIDNDLKSHTYIGSTEISGDIRTELCGQQASKIAVIPEVRAALLQKQRDFAVAPGLVTDGRDMGTVVFPDANLKLYLYASLEERARRRYIQLQGSEKSDNIAQVIEQLAERDARDSNRLHAPLVSAANAVQIDTTGLSIEAVFAKVVDLVNEHGFRREL